MIKQFSFFCVAFTLSLPIASAEFFVQDLVNGSGNLPIPGNQAWTGQLGDDFVTGANPLAISRIGVFDSNGNGTTSVLTWNLYTVSDGALVTSIDVPVSAATGGSGIESNYIWLPANIILSANTAYSVVAVGFNGDVNNPFSDLNFNTNMNLSTLDVDFTALGLTAAGGRYSASGVTTGLPTVDVGNTVSTQLYNFGAATFDFTATPEPTTLVVWSGLAAIGGFVAYRRRTAA